MGYGFGILLLTVVTFEITMGLIVSTLPDPRQRPWTQSDRRRIRWIGAIGLGFWPTIALTVYVHRTFDGPGVWAYDAILVCSIVLLIRTAWKRRHRHKLVNLGHCDHCHYDLVGSLDAMDCPECGEAVNDHVRAAAKTRSGQRQP